MEMTVDESGRPELAAAIHSAVDISAEVAANVYESIVLEDDVPVGNELWPRPS